VADALASAAAKLSGGGRSSDAMASPETSGTTHGGKP
jgi:hypothetical protein